MSELKPIHSNEDYEDALRLLSDLWGAKSGTPEGDQLDMLATLLDSYEAEHFPMDDPTPEASAKFRAEQESNIGVAKTTLHERYVFEVFKKREGSFSFRLVSTNGEIIFISDAFGSKAEAVAAIEILRASVSRSRIVERAA